MKSPDFLTLRSAPMEVKSQELTLMLRETALACAPTSCSNQSKNSLEGFDCLKAVDLADIRKQTSNRLHFECFCSSFGILLEKY